MKKGAVVPDADILGKLGKLKTEEKGEFIVKAVEYGSNIYVSACTLDGLMAFHPPYVIQANGKMDYMEPDSGRIKEVFEKGEVIYNNPHIKINSLKDYI